MAFLPTPYTLHDTPTLPKVVQTTITPIGGALSAKLFPYPQNAKPAIFRLLQTTLSPVDGGNNLKPIPPLPGAGGGGGGGAVTVGYAT